MRCVKWLSFLFIVALIAVLVPFSVSAASPSIDDIKVYQGYEETGDWIFVAVYNISGGNISNCTNTSCCDPYSYPWYIQLIDNTTSTVITENALKQCGMRPACIYRSYNATTSLTWGGNYSIKIYGNYGATPNVSKAIGATDWKGTGLSYLGDWVIYQAGIIETYDSETYIETVSQPYYEVLNVEGGKIFDTGIPYLSSYIPEIFLVTLDKVSIGYNPTNSSKVYEAGLYNNWDTALGPDISGALDSAAPYFGFTGADRGRMVGALLMFMGFISLALISKTIAFLIIIGGVVIGLVPMSLVFVIVFILLVVLVRSLFWSST